MVMIEFSQNLLIQKLVLIIKVVRPLALTLFKMGGYVKLFKVKDRDKDKNNT